MGMHKDVNEGLKIGRLWSQFERELLVFYHSDKRKKTVS